MSGRPLPRWLVKLDEPAITGIYLAYRDLFRRIQRRPS